jgi:hypothetical protein
MCLFFPNHATSAPVSLVPRSAVRLKVPGVRFHELGWKEPLWRIGMAWNRNSEKLSLISRLVEVVQAIVDDFYQQS